MRAASKAQCVAISREDGCLPNKLRLLVAWSRDKIRG